MSQKEATKPGRAFTSSVCLEIVIPFPASALLETVLGSEGSAGVLLERQRTKMDFPMAHPTEQYLHQIQLHFSYV